jgi:hypothetical protein
MQDADRIRRDPTDPEEIRASLAEHQRITDEMLTILSSFDQRLQWLEQSTVPIHDLTQNLTRAQTNIDTALVEIEKVNSNLGVVQEVDLDHLKKTLDDSTDISAFLDGVEKLNDAKLFLRTKDSFKSTSSALSEIDAQLRRAMMDCQMEFGRLIGRYTPDASTSNAHAEHKIAQGGTWCLNDDEVVTKVQQLCECMESCGHDGYIHAYAEQRSAAFAAALEEHKRMVAEEGHFSSTPFTGKTASGAAAAYESSSADGVDGPGDVDGGGGGGEGGGKTIGCSPAQRGRSPSIRASISGSMRGRSPAKRASMAPSTTTPSSMLMTPTPRKKRQSLAVMGGQMLLGKGKSKGYGSTVDFGMGSMSSASSSSYMRGAHPFVHLLRFFVKEVGNEYTLAEDLLTSTNAPPRALSSQAHPTLNPTLSGAQSHSHTDTRYMVGQRHLVLTLLVASSVETLCREGMRAISSVKAAINLDLQNAGADKSAAGASDASVASGGALNVHGGHHAGAGVLAALDLARSMERALPRLTDKLQTPLEDGNSTDKEGENGGGGGDGGRSKAAGRGGKRQQKSAQLSQLQGLHSSLMENATQGMHQYLVLIATGISSTTTDGTVHPLTSSTLRLLQDLLRFRFEPITDQLCNLERAQLTPTMSASAAALSTADYARKVVTALHTALQERLEQERQSQRSSSKQAGGQSSGVNEMCVLPHLFLLNNLHFMLKSIKGETEEDGGEGGMPPALKLCVGGQDDEEELEEDELEDEALLSKHGVTRARTLAELIGASQIE